jgi:lipid A 3-O-deacylase
MHKGLPGLIVALLISAAAQATAAERPVLSLGFENDQFGQPATDRYYTQGARLALRHGSGDRPFWHGALAWVPLLADGSSISHESGLVQLISTPSTILANEVRRGDRPYAGLLAATIAITGTAPSGRRSDQISLTLGIIGPGSLADPAQTLTHRLIGAREPLGWRTQLGTEPAINLAWRRSWRFAGPGMALVPHIGAALGNVHDHAAAGATLHLGARPADHAAAALDPFVPGIAALQAGDRPRLGLLVGVEGRAVARNLFLDGNSFTAGRGVRKHALVGDVMAGGALSWGGVRLSLRHVWRSREFAGQRGIQRFGALTLDIGL